MAGEGSGRRTGEDVVVDVDDLPRRFAYRQGRVFAWCTGLLGAVGLAQVVLQLSRPGESDLVLLGVGLVQVLLGTVSVLGDRRSTVVLGPHGVRVTGLHRRTLPWSRVREVRPPGRWAEHAEVRGARAADQPVPLLGLTAEHARELRTRVEAARARTAGARPADAGGGP